MKQILAMISICIATSAAADTKEEINYLLDKIHKYSNAFIINTDDCNGKVYGFYNPRRNHFIVCTDLANDEESFNETLKHEAWHMVQDCGNGIKSPNSVLQNPMESIFYHSDAETIKFVLTTYSYHRTLKQTAIELEAFFFEDYSATYVADALIQVCEKYKEES